MEKCHSSIHMHGVGLAGQLCIRIESNKKNKTRKHPGSLGETSNNSLLMPQICSRRAVSEWTLSQLKKRS